MSKQIYKIDPQNLKFIIENGSRISTNGELYCFLPYWFEIKDVELGTCIFHSLYEDMPQELIDAVREDRKIEPYGYLYEEQFFRLKEHITAQLGYKYNEEDVVPLYK